MSSLRGRYDQILVVAGNPHWRKVLVGRPFDRDFSAQFQCGWKIAVLGGGQFARVLKTKYFFDPGDIRFNGADGPITKDAFGRGVH